jgi:uncharacterized repeat protein (TIGR03803 family)
LFAVNTDGPGFTTLHAFGGPDDGTHPLNGLLLSGSTLYGMTDGGGSLHNGTVFAVNTNGTDYTLLHNFSGGSDGSFPYDALILSGNTLYGTTSEWVSGYGTVFSLSLPLPQLAIILSGTNVVLTWTNTASGFTLQTSPELGPSALWSDSVDSPVIVAGQYFVTNLIKSGPLFYRLAQ